MLGVMIQSNKLLQITERARQIQQWLDDWAPYPSHDQRHLDSGTPEQAYWHLGYAAALRDAVVLINEGHGRTQDTSSDCQPNE